MVRSTLVVLIFFLGIAVPWAEEESSAQNLDRAKQGMAEATWPKKPDNRMSPLSGKMKDTAEISPQFYGQEKEISVKQAGEWQKVARMGQKDLWEGSVGRGWEEARWNQQRDWAEGENQNQKFQPGRESADEKLVKYRELEREGAPDWSSRSSSFARPSDGSPGAYEGRLTRVRQQVRQDETNPRDLGEGKQEKFSPQEVEKLLSQPVGDFRRAVREQSPRASPLAAADN